MGLSKRKSLLLLVSIIVSMSFLVSAASWKSNIEAICETSERDNISAPESKVTLNGEPVEQIECDRLDEYSYAEMDITPQPPHNTTSEYILSILLLPLLPVLYGYRSGEGLKTLKTALIGFLAPSAGFVSGVIVASISSTDGTLPALIGLCIPVFYAVRLFRSDSSMLQLGTFVLSMICTVIAWLSIFLVSFTL